MSLFEIDIISEPMSAVGFPEIILNDDLPRLAAYDEEILKPALLFADKITLVTSREDLRVRLKSDAASARMPMRAIGYFLRVSRTRNPEELEGLGLKESGLATEEELREEEEDSRRRAKTHAALTPEERAKDFDESTLSRLSVKYQEQIWQATLARLDHLKSQYDALAASEIAPAVAAGLVKIVGWGEEREMWELVWEREEEYFMRTHVDLLERVYLSDSMPMLDPHLQLPLSAELMPASKLRSAAVPSLSSESLVASTTCAHLPGLDRLSIKEIVDLRSSLNDYLPGFRAEMVRINDEINSTEGLTRKDVQREVDRHWARDIHPILAEIEHNVKLASLPRQVLRSLTTERDTMVSTAGSVVLATGSAFAGAATFIPAVATATYPLLKSLNSIIEAKAELRQNRLFFLYAAAKQISRKARRKRASE